MYDKGILLLNNWQKGMADSPYLGNASVVGCNIFETPGILKPENRTAAITTSTYTGMPVAHIRDNFSGNYFTVTDDGKFYKNDTLVASGFTAGGLQNYPDIIFHQDYVLISDGPYIHAYGPVSASPTMTLQWKNTLNASYYHKMVEANDLSTSLTSTAVYITNGNTLAKLNAVTNGLAGNPPATGTLTLSVLTLPPNHYASTMSLLGTNLLIGTKSTYGRMAKIFPWDKLTTHSYDKPVTLNEIGVNSMISDNNKTYISAGVRGNIYVTDGSNYRIIKRIPYATKGAFAGRSFVYPNSMAFHSNGNLLVGVSTLDSNSSNDGKFGVYELAVNNEGTPLCLKNLISSGTVTGVNGVLKIGVVATFDDDAIYIGWTSGTTYGLDQTTFRMYTSYASYFESALIQTGDNLTPKTFQNLEFRLGSPLISGQGIKIEYRKNLNDSYTTIGTFDYSTLGGVISHNTPALITDAEQVQIKISLTQATTTPVPANVELIYLKIW